MTHLRDQGELPLPGPKRTPPDYVGESRKELTEALALARAATDQPPWDYRRQGYWRIVFRQMSGWLPAAEAEALCDEFYRELERIEQLFVERRKNDERCVSAFEQGRAAGRSGEGKAANPHRPEGDIELYQSWELGRLEGVEQERESNG